MSISDEAVQAAVKAWQTLDGAPGSWTIEGNLRKVLEAAAPHMLRDALACGWDAAVASMVYPDGSKVEVAENTNPYRPTK